MNHSQCIHFESCPGCTEWTVSLREQIVAKKNTLHRLLKPHLMNLESSEDIFCHSVGSGKHRVWFDLQFSAHGLGLFNRDHKVEPITDCSLMTPELQSFFSKLQKVKFPHKKISARLRISPHGTFGLWLDLANDDVKELLIEKTFLNQLCQIANIVEIGQRRKFLNTAVEENSQFKLIDPVLHPWFQTREFPLSCYVGSFTQPSWVSADFITDEILNWSTGCHHITEFGSGIGQYTLPLLQNKSYVSVYENNPLAVNALKHNTKNYTDRLTVNPEFKSKSDLYLVNPPRSGLGNFCEQINSSNVEWVIYVSCSAESLKTDLDVLSKNYAISDLKIVDQFPNSKHFETCVLLTKR